MKPIEIVDNATLNPKLSRNDWWSSRRSKYNKGLVIAGIVAFISYVILGDFLLLQNDKEYEVTLFTIFFQGMGYLFMMLIANLFYNLGSWADKHYNKNDTEEFRQRLFNFGYWFSFGLPFLVPILVIVVYLFEYRK